MPIDIKQRTVGFEGTREELYDDGKGNTTLGVGHLATDEDKKKYANRKIPKEDIDAILDEDIAEHLKRVRKAYPKYDSYTEGQRAALFDGMFRGDMGPKASPETYRLILLGRWDDAAEEYLNSDEYRESRWEKPHAKNTVWNRMESNAELMRSQA